MLNNNYLLTNIPYFKQVYHISVLILNQILNNNLNCIYHSRVLVFLFFLLLFLFCNYVMVHLGCQGFFVGWSVLLAWGIVIVSVLLSCKLSSLLLSAGLHSNPLPPNWNLLFLGLRQTVHRCGIVVPIYTFLMVVHIMH